MRVLIAAGGTAGHINPALAIAGALKAADPQAEIHFAGRREGMEYGLVTKAGYPFHHIEINGFQRRLNAENIARNVVAVWHLALSGPRTRKILNEVQPDLVIGCGGYVSGPVVRAAAKRGIKTAIHEQNAFPGVTNKLLAKDVDLVLAASADAVEKLGLGKADATGRTTINIGMARLSGGRITLTADMRLAAIYSPSVAINALSRALGDGTEIKTLHYAPPLVHDENGKLVRTLMEVYRECTGDTTSRPLHIGGGTYAKELPGCIAFGAVFPGRDTRMHDSDECYPLSDFEKLTEICYRAVIALDREFAAE